MTVKPVALRPSTTLALSFVLSLAYAAGSNAQEAGPPRSCESVMDHEVCVWIVEEGPEVLELGATIPMGLIEGVSLDAEMTWPPREMAVVQLPARATERLGIDHLTINWEAHGHPPTTFATPHFDFHFYSIPRDVVERVDCSDGAKPAVVPEGYALPDVDVPGLGTLVGLCVPRMGMHAMPEGDLRSGDPFSASMIVGYYGGDAIFIEPMVSRDRLLERTDFTLPVPVVDELPTGVLYPSTFRATYDAESDQYRLVMTGFGELGG